MIALIQRVKHAKVTYSSQTSSINQGLLVFLGIHKDDTSKEVDKLVKKLLNLRVLADDNDKMNLSLLETKQELLVISQFTLLGNSKGGNRPSFISAAAPDKALPLYELFIDQCRHAKIDTKTGFFGKYMSVELLNDGPTTLILDTKDF